MKNFFHRLYVRLLVASGRAIDIRSSGHYPADMLSNMRSNKFTLDGVECGSMEGFLQGLKQQQPDAQRNVCALKGRDARTAATRQWQADQRLYWKGEAIQRQSAEYQDLLKRAYQALYDQCSRFRTALQATGEKRLFYTHGHHDPTTTILTEQEFCQILTFVRESNRNQHHFGDGRHK